MKNIPIILQATCYIKGCVMLNIKYVIKNYTLVILGCFLALFLGLHDNAGIILLCLWGFLPIWFIYTLYLIQKNKQCKLSLIIKTILWLIVVAVLLAWVNYMPTHRKEQANLLAAKIMQYKKKNGYYPVNLDSLAPGATRYWHQDMRVYYSYAMQKPSLFYPSPVNQYQRYYYDFMRQEWKNHYIG